ncbi:uncharacterized protein VTP21DRAFT_2000 [Calcarisporiella thermophila]|uniref:uncharacterized protein n=1 Tax=Calcarisporiella thermophila TaxID=911321 RepID=UPI00374419B0
MTSPLSESVNGSVKATNKGNADDKSTSVTTRLCTLPPSPHSGPRQEQFPDYLRMILTARVYEIIKETPLQHAYGLSNKTSCNVLLKREDLMPVFSFKIRGAYNKMAHLTSKERDAGVIACSAGNHAQGVAMAAKHLGIKSTIVMPMGTPEIKHRNVSRLGGQVVLHGADFDEAKRECARLAQVHGYTDIPPYDDPYVIAGQGTVGVEILRQHNLDEIDTIFACVGGGGLLAGVAAYVKRLCPKIRIVGVETYDADAMTKSLEKGERVVLKEAGLFADGKAVRVVGKETFRLCKELVDDMVLVSNDEICAAIKDIFEDTRSICEPSGALSVAGLKKYVSLHPHLQNRTHVAILSGANMNFSRLRFVAERAELGEQTEALLSVIIPEQPGSFMKLYKLIYPRNVTEFSYRYSDPKNAWIYTSFVVKDRMKEVSEVLEELQQYGMTGWDISENEMAKSHGRYLIGGRMKVEHERLFRFEFPERPGALKKFLEGMQSDWNISLFHYRNHGADIAKVLVGIQVPPSENEAFKEFLKKLNYYYVDETDNIVYKMFLS